MIEPQVHSAPPAAVQVGEPFLQGKRLVRFEALQNALVPRSAGFSEAQRTESRRLVNQLVGNMPAANQRKLGLFLAIIDLLSMFFGLRAFRRLSPVKQKAVLVWLFDSPVGLLRKGFWGLNTVARMGVYGQPGLYDEIGYKVRETPHD